MPDLDVMVTEFDLGHDDDVIRADWFEDTMRGFFAHPVLRGIILWGFWNNRMRYENKYLAYGPRFKVICTHTHKYSHTHAHTHKHTRTHNLLQVHTKSPSYVMHYLILVFQYFYIDLNT